MEAKPGVETKLLVQQMSRMMKISRRNTVQDWNGSRPTQNESKELRNVCVEKKNLPIKQNCKGNNKPLKHQQKAASRRQQKECIRHCANKAMGENKSEVIQISQSCASQDTTGSRSLSALTCVAIVGQEVDAEPRKLAAH